VIFEAVHSLVNVIVLLVERLLAHKEILRSNRAAIPAASDDRDCPPRLPNLLII